MSIACVLCVLRQWDLRAGGVDIRRYSRTRNPVFPIKIPPYRSRLRQALMRPQPAGKVATGQLLKGLWFLILRNGRGYEGLSL